MARRRFQNGSVFERGKKRKVWVGRWREDIITADGRLTRCEKKEVLGTKEEYPTKRLALRALQLRIAEINSPTYRPQVSVTFAEFVTRWKNIVLPNYKASTQAHLKSDIDHHLIPRLGNVLLRHITTELVQSFVSQISTSPKTAHNVVAVLRSVWKTAKAWQYVTHDPFSGLVLPKVDKPEPRCFTVEEAVRVIDAAREPFKTLYWLAAETGMRAGELCALEWEDFDFERSLVFVRRSAWKGVQQATKTAAGRRSFSLSPQLTEHLLGQRKQTGLVFPTKDGRPRQGGKIVEKNLGPLLKQLGIAHRGLHAFRHLNGSLMDVLSIPLKVRQQRLGHTTALLTLERYTHVLSDDDRRFASEMGAILRPNAPNSSGDGTGTQG